MSKNEIVRWHSSYSIGIPLIDAQHRELINLTNKLYEGCMSGREVSRVVFLRTVRGAVDYIGYHFSTEEKIMERVSYPYAEYSIHKQQHNDFVREVLREVDDFSSGKKFTPNAFVYFLKDRVLTHIAVTDKKLGEFLVDMKRRGGMRGMTVQVKQQANTNRMIIR
ncbi:MAG: bacteriohemerythrin [Treponema sp.]|jgi:hemerythrin|nr:bacteriohemerythrin [Treponema sp.]